MEHAAEIISITNQIKSHKETLAQLKATLQERMELLEQDMVTRGVTQFEFQDVVFDLVNVSRKNINKNARVSHIQNVLSTHGITPSTSIINQILSVEAPTTNSSKILLKHH